MKHTGLVLVLTLALAACNPAPSKQAPSDSASDAAPAATGTTPPPSEGATALLDSLSNPRQKGRYAPRDECAEQPGATEFRHQLAAAVAKGDAQAIAALASPNVKLGFGGDDGKARFLERLQDPDGELMAELRQVLPLGCAVNPEGNLTMPWYFAEDMGDIDTYAAMIVTGEDVPLYTRADAASPAKQRLSWDAVELRGGLFPDRAFQRVRTNDGTEGFVATGKLRSLLDYRLLVSRENGAWKITAIVSGD
jgi:hypothetical protein